MALHRRIDLKVRKAAEPGVRNGSRPFEPPDTKAGKNFLEI